MNGVYSVEDLLRLRASPLICRPPNLPPTEEWMGSQEPSGKRPVTRGRQEDGSFHTEGFQKRPTLDPSMRKSTTDPERIVLGPPRRSFASSNARTFNKTGASELADAQKEGNGRHERAKTGDELEHKYSDRKSGQIGGTNGRYASRHDADHERPRRRYDEEDGEGRPRREQDRPRWGRDDKANEELDDGGYSKTAFKRDPQSRSRFEQSWLRNDRGTEEGRRESERPGWRRDRGKDGDWDVPGKSDIDPEWMDAVDTPEPAQARTLEDLQRWKEQMKAAATGTVTEKSEAATKANTNLDEKQKSQQAPGLTGVTTPDLASNSMDKFFAKFTEKRTMTEERGPASKPAAKSKFASLFGAPADPKPEAPSMPMGPPIQTSPAPVPIQQAKSPMPSSEHMNLPMDDDQAGFKRILEMLGKRDATPAAEASKTRASDHNGRQQQEQYQSPDLITLFKQNQSSNKTPSSQGPPGLERLIESRSPAEGHRRQETPNKDEILLSLLRKAEISARSSQQPQREHEQRLPPGLFASMNEPMRNDPRQANNERPEMEQQAAIQQRTNGRSMFDDPAISNIAYQDDMNARQGLQRRPTNGYDDAYLDRLRKQEQQKSMQPPPGMSRPPGLEQMGRMPPGWAQGLGPHQQPRPAPPGINVPRGMQSPFGPPQQPPMPPMPQQGARSAQRKYTGESSAPNFPPGIGPPPGFLTNGPPPGFHHSGAGNQAQNYARYGITGENQGLQQQGPPNMGRAFMEMYSGGGGGGGGGGVGERGGLRSGNGGVPLPPGFR